MINLKNLLNDLDLPSDVWIGLRELRQNSVIRKIRNGKPELNHHVTTHGVMVEVLSKGHFAYAATCHLDPTSIRFAAWMAFARAQTLASRKLFDFSVEQRPSHEGRFTTAIESPVNSMSPDFFVDTLVRIGARLKVSPQIVNTSVTFRFDDVKTHYVSRNGSDIQQQFYYSALDFSATAQDGLQSQTRSANGFLARCYQKGLEMLDTEVLFPQAVRTGEEAIELLNAPNCPTGPMSLVLMPDQMYMQIHESIGHPLELDRILGDEYNYAGTSFVNLQDFGTLQYGSPLLNAVYDPTVRGEYASFAFDDVGNPAKREILIENGILKRPLGGLESQARAKMPGVANSRSVYWNRAPIDRMGNINLMPGSTAYKDLIGKVENGIIMDTNRSWSIDDRREKFQFGCEYGRLIKDGQITGVVKNPNYRGDTLKFWRALKDLGDEKTWAMFGYPFCGKGEPNQVVRVGHGSPVAHFGQVEVFGGAS